MKKVEKVFQVLNGSLLPAGGSFEGLALFETRKQAEAWIDYLVHECSNDNEKFTIIERRLLRRV